LNVVAHSFQPEIEAALEPYIYEVVRTCLTLLSLRPALTATTIEKLRGSISAEHGIGAMKTHALPYSKSQSSIELMHRIKKVFDPNGILNPGKVLE
jgi:(R)-2-hydroxyglutarate---pyruvate transhydrogenase